MARLETCRRLPLAALLILLFFGHPLFAVQPAVTTSSADSTESFILSRIILAGNKITNSQIILRELPFNVGDTVDSKQVTYARERIYSTGLFAKVTTSVKQAAGGQGDLYIDVEERWYIWPYPVFGFWDRDIKKLYLGAGIIDLNLSGLDDPLWASFALGYNPFGGITYSNPAVGANKAYMVTLSANYSHGMAFGDQSLYSSGEFNAVFGNLGIDVGRRFGIFSSLSLSLRYNYVSESSDSANLVLSPTGKDIFASAGIDFVYDSRDIKSYATKGLYLDLSVVKYGLGESIVDFSRGMFDGRAFVPVFHDLIIASRLHGNIAEGPAIPPYERVFVGYYERIRGMFNTVSEGKTALGGNLELRIPIIRSYYLEIPNFPLKQFASNRLGLYWTFFFDAGETSDKHLVNMTMQRLLWGYGGGLTFLLPYDIVVQTDYARGNNGHWEFDLVLGESI